MPLNEFFAFSLQGTDSAVDEVPMSCGTYCMQFYICMISLHAVDGGLLCMVWPGLPVLLYAITIQVKANIEKSEIQTAGCILYIAKWCHWWGMLCTVPLPFLSLMHPISTVYVVALQFEV